MVSWGLLDGAASSSLFEVLLLALLLDLLFGDPAWLYRRVPHPVAAFGALIGWLETRVNRAADGPIQAFCKGLAVTLTAVLAAFVVGAVLRDLLAGLPLGWLLEAVIVAALLAYRGLLDYVLRVARGLDSSLEAGRAAVSHIVGRDPDSLDRGGVARAAVESLAENFSDATVAPIFWYLLLGLPGLLAYKAINTLDSMIGHRSPRYLWFGKAAARIDDLVNLIPARLSGLLLVFAACLLPRADAVGAWAAMLRDARRHRSPNAGWPEAAMAGALGFALAGPRRYGQAEVSDPWVGRGRPDLDAADIRAAVRLYLAAGALILAAMLLSVLLA